MNQSLSSARSLSRSERWFLIALLAAGLLIRVMYILEVRGNPFFEHPRLDALFHDRWAQSIAAGNVVGDSVFFRAPGYAYFLGAIYSVFGHDYLMPRVIQHLLGIATLFLLYLVARRFGGPGIAMLASSLALLNPMLLYFEGELLFEALLTFLILLFFASATRIADNPLRIRWTCTGLIFGLLCIVRPTFLAIAPVLFATLSWQREENKKGHLQWKSFLFLSLGCLIPILPVAIRNYVVGDDIVLVASQGGVNFYIGNNPQADGYSSSMPSRRGAGWENRDQTFQVGKALGHTPHPSEESWYWYRQGFRFILDQPLQFLSLLARKAYLFVNAYEIPNNQNFYSFSRYSFLLRWLPAGFWLIGPLGIAGMVITLRNWKSISLTWFVALYTAITIAFFVCDRFRLPLVPFVALFASATAFALVETVRTARWRTLAWMGAAIILLAVVVNSDLYGIRTDSTARDAMTRGIVELESGQPARAIASFTESEEASRIPPPNLFLNRGVAEWRLGNDSNAVAYFHNELAHYGDSYGAMCNLSSIFLARKSMDSALSFAMQALACKPYLPRAYVSAAQALFIIGDSTGAVNLLLKGASACGKDFVEGNLLLAEVRFKTGMVTSAESLFTAIARIEQQDHQPLYEPDLNFVEAGVSGEDLRRFKSSAMQGLALIADQRGDRSGAVAWLQRSAALSPDNADVLSDYALALMHTRHFAEADSLLNRVLALSPASPVFWYNYATLLGITGRLDEAETAFGRVVALQPGFADAQQKIEIIRRIRAAR
jgi:tetratricopeptide (TPR) repeat protein